MNRPILFAISLAMATTAFAQGGWKNPATITATISERHEQSAARETTVTRKGDNYSYTTNNEIDGMLGGVERVEIASPKGFYTWLPNRPELVLRLWAPTSPDVFDYLAKPNFSRADLEVYLEGIEKALGKKVLVGKSEKIAERDCLVLTILDKPGSSDDYQRLWIDRETGIAMKLVDVVRSNTVYEREVKSISFNSAGADVLFAPKDGAKVLSGIILPTTLVNAGAPAGADSFRRDIAAINQKSGTPWAGASEDLGGFGYTGSNFRQIRRERFQVGTERVDPREAARQRRQQQRGNQIAQRAQWVAQSAEGVSMQTIELRFAEAGGPSGQQGNMIVTTTGLPPTVGSSGATTPGGTNNASGSIVYPMVQSDFVNPNTGDTLTLLQIDKRDLKPWLLQLGLDEGVVVPNEGAGNARFHVSNGPVKVNVLTWQVNQSHLALVSTNLNKDQLVDLAGKIQPSR